MSVSLGRRQPLKEWWMSTKINTHHLVIIIFMVSLSSLWQNTELDTRTKPVRKGRAFVIGLYKLAMGRFLLLNYRYSYGRRMFTVQFLSNINEARRKNNDGNTATTLILRNVIPVLNDWVTVPLSHNIIWKTIFTHPISRCTEKHATSNMHNNHLPTTKTHIIAICTNKQ